MSEKLKKLAVWGMGVIGCMLYLLPAVNRFYVACVSGSDDVWFQMWCYLWVALAGLFLPWLISRKSTWGVCLGAVLGGTASVVLLSVACEVWGSYSDYQLIDGWAGELIALVFLWGGIVLFGLAGLLPCFRRNLRAASTTERKWLRYGGRVFVSVLGGLGLMVLTILAAWCVAFDRYDLLWWEYVLIWPLNIALFAPMFWPIAELLPSGRWQRVSFRLFLYMMLPGLLAAVPALFLDDIIAYPGDDLLMVQLIVSALPLAIGVLLWRYVRRRIAESASGSEQ